VAGPVANVAVEVSLVVALVALLPPRAGSRVGRRGHRRRANTPIGVSCRGGEGRAFPARGSRSEGAKARGRWDGNPERGVLCPPPTSSSRPCHRFRVEKHGFGNPTTAIRRARGGQTEEAEARRTLLGERRGRGTLGGRATGSDPSSHPVVTTQRSARPGQGRRGVSAPLAGARGRGQSRPTRRRAGVLWRAWRTFGRDPGRTSSTPHRDPLRQNTSPAEQLSERTPHRRSTSPSPAPPWPSSPTAELRGDAQVARVPGRCLHGRSVPGERGGRMPCPP